MRSHAGRLHATVAIVCPIVGVSIGVVGDSSSVTFDAPTATDPQKTAAQSAINAFDWSDAAQDSWEEDQLPDRKTLKQAAAQAIADIDTYLALASSTNAQDKAAIRRLAQMVKQLIKRTVQL